MPAAARRRAEAALAGSGTADGAAAPKAMLSDGNEVRVFLYCILLRNVLSIVNPFDTVYWLFVVPSRYPVVRPIAKLELGV